jgi:conjugal transfer/type IV secretion protein DotA/TraY
MASVQLAVFNNVLTGSIRPNVATVAQNLWQTKNASALSGLQSIYVSAVQSYSGALTAAATQAQQEISAALQANAAQARSGSLDLNASASQQSTLGWTSAGAYYLEIARANAATLSLMSAVPVVTPPTWQGLPRSLALDIAPFEQQVSAYLTTLATIVNSQDGIDQPSGSPSTLAGAQQQQESMSLLSKLFAQMQLNGTSVNRIIALLNQTNATVWTDPFGGLMSLGQTLLTIGLSGLAIAAVLSSPTASGAVTLWNVVTFNWGGAAATVVGHTVVSFLATPVFALMMALITPGIIISYVLPMIPYVFWMAGVCGWIILVCEAMVAVPLWMLAHMTVGGDGLHGRAVEGWAMLFNVMFRPVLMLLGLFLSYFVFACMSWLTRQSFGIAAGFVLASGNLVTNVIGVVVLMNIFVMLQIVCAFMSFRMVALLPHHLPRMIGFTSGNRVDTEAFGQQAAWGPGNAMAIGAQQQLLRGLDGFRDRTEQGQLTNSGNGRQLQGPGGGAGNDSMDTTLRAMTDSSGSGEVEH